MELLSCYPLIIRLWKFHSASTVPCWKANFLSCTHSYSSSPYLAVRHLCLADASVGAAFASIRLCLPADSLPSPRSSVPDLGFYTVTATVTRLVLEPRRRCLASIRPYLSCRRQLPLGRQFLTWASILSRLQSLDLSWNYDHDDSKRYRL